ncbi:hypothetical protein CEP10_00890 [Cylindrospermopsis raciborskii S07]|uniref:Uncharacterized protein n=3 Tax=Cylindrospermopsis raciborskii TaxID=77022 RepID=A0A853MIP3_9CYAN|nr:hypothetical protein [Cylindrospermopsis raciborskii]EFA68585.1 conserved hypothetical protein [Cylindrospermopsis raciborskii CS-505]MBA4447036.1 hypothetical protein [Cylindrospermopsis raciborskii CS-506_C]MBA4451296.1 hypothetical protein [Cylindrospermopsis raciborskii CS-506_D]MBA4457893.1 hypothetical protein [Cylindrospermopsis raciborskii CS-506_B]MBA4467277.1 hypothetical protein [Cylindrospermopsis raciborskii CS-506_A]
MPRKRLTDLLQEEVQKFTPDESVVETTAKKIPDLELPEDGSNSVTIVSSNSTSDNSNGLHWGVTVQELQESLNRYHVRETAMQQEICELKNALSEQRSLSEKLGKELYETKKTALKLAESNSTLIEENNQLKQQTAQQVIPNSTGESVQSTQPTKDVAKSLVINPRKSYSPPEIFIDKSKADTKKDDFSNNTWLYD